MSKACNTTRVKLTKTGYNLRSRLKRIPVRYKMAEIYNTSANPAGRDQS